MGLSVFAARDEFGTVYAALTNCDGRDEVQEWLKEGGVSDSVIAFLPIPENNASVVLEGLFHLAEFTEDFDRFLTYVFKLGMEVQNSER
ncbi:hypothetical protein HYW67_03260 [Candidatus Parcubacteria bacterium]|nr:hypothetical protein [Candidatus Parcubacteria bacterium]